MWRGLKARQWTFRKQKTIKGAQIKKYRDEIGIQRG